MKKKIIIISILVVIAISIIGLYNTFAIDDRAISDNTYDIILDSSNSTLTIPANSSKTIIYKIYNNNDGTVQYGVGYASSSNIIVSVYKKSKVPSTGTIGDKEYKFIKLNIVNTGSIPEVVTLSTILGYENGGNLIVPSGVTLVTEGIKNASNFITNLYTNAKKTTVINNNITYNYATSVSMMNDRLGGTTASLDGGNIRYYGKDPNNYIYFNCDDYNNQTKDTCELWRIIGVFIDKVKIVRDTSIGAYSWNSHNMNPDPGTVEIGEAENDWTIASLMKLLNPSKYYQMDPNDNGLGESLYYNSESGTCFISNATTCDFTKTGLKNDETRNKIAEITWNIGGHDSNQVYSDQIYNYERGTKVYSGRPTTWTGKIALMYPSDYGYASDFISCNKMLNAYNDKACISTNYLYKGSSEWSLVPDSSDENLAWHVFSDGSIYTNMDIASALNVHPTLFLNLDEVISSGDGSSTNPYQLLS